MDLYWILWVDKNATKDEIKKAYRKLAMQHHPDRNSQDKESEKKFKEINEAYSVLWDDSKRKQYDMFWKVWWAWASSNWFNVDFDLWDIFESFFWWARWGYREKPSSMPWEDLEKIIEIDLKTSIFWWKQKIKINKQETCWDCKWEWWEWKKTCSKCNWTWHITFTRQSAFWIIQQTWLCDDCSWTWETFEKICPVCYWKKRKLVSKEIGIDIPAWIDDGMIIKLTWEWNDWINTKASWDLYIKFQVSLEEKWLTREEYDLHYNLEIDVLEAVLWTKKEVNLPIIWKRTIDIKAWTDHSSVIKISWDWVKHVNDDKKWDLYLEISIKIPKKLTKTERDLYEKIASEKKINVNNKKWIFESLFD